MTGTDQRALDIAIPEHYAPGQVVDLFLELPRELRHDEVLAVRRNLESQGLDIRSAQMGAFGDWPNTLRLQFKRPARPQGYAVLPLAVMVIGALGAVGVASFLGWKLGNIVDSIGKNILPILAIGVAGLLGYKFLQQKGSVA